MFFKNREITNVMSKTICNCIVSIQFSITIFDFLLRLNYLCVINLFKTKYLLRNGFQMYYYIESQCIIFYFVSCDKNHTLYFVYNNIYRSLRVRRDMSPAGIVRIIGDILCEHVRNN